MSWRFWPTHLGSNILEVPFLGRGKEVGYNLKSLVGGLCSFVARVLVVNSWVKSCSCGLGGGGA